jgi:TPR repeat protein
MYFNGRGVPQDLDEAIRWVRLAADQGFVKAQFNLGLSYDTGTGVPPDPAEAARWFRRAANQGDATAQRNLGVMYANGEGVPRDFVAAYMWLGLAAAQASGAARAAALQGRDVVAQQLTPAQIADAEQRAQTWTPVPER